MKKLSIFLLATLFIFSAKADEGMWMLPLIKKLNIQQMNGMGCTLTAEDIYSESNISLKDAIIVFGNGCTGVVVSNQGLIFTNHHCGYGAIQQHSTVEHNYLKNGFTAEKIEDEIPTPGLTVKFLVSITDVTQRLISQLPEDLVGEKRKTKQDSILKVVKEEAQKDNKYIVQVKSFFSGNQFYIFVYDEYTDIRFAYAPPTSIGKFGADTDNWMWPRHTGDFSVFRVYADKDGKPAEYSKDNIPLSSKRFVTISNQGYSSGDYSMIMGNPGTTTRYLSSWGIENRMKTANQSRIDVRGAKQKVWMSFMKADEAINIAYSSKFAGSSNYWKNSIGMNNAIAKLKIIDRKQADEKVFAEWVNKNDARKANYGNVLSDLETAYNTVFPYSKAISYLRESLVSGVELPRIASQAKKLSQKKLSSDSILIEATEIYKNYYSQVDEASFVVMLDEYKKAADADALPEIYNIIQKKYKGNYAKYVKSVFAKSSFTTFEKFQKAIAKSNTNFDKDPAIIFWKDINSTLNSLQKEEYNQAMDKIADANRLYEAGLLEMAAENGKSMYPDANFTMRLTYGTIGGYQPADAISYNYYSTTKGVLEKEKPGDYEFNVPQELKKAIQEKDYGAYIDTKTGEMHVGFLSNNDITGGNSGSPIFNAKGELIGLAFDGNWEAMSGDIVFEPDLQRTINVDIRYVLFVMDKVGGAKRLLEELKIN